MSTMPTANGVSRTLGKRHARSTSTGTRVRGYRSVTAGFEVSTIGTGDRVLVEHRLASGVRKPGVDHGALIERKVSAYAETLTAAGYEVTTERRGALSSVVVTGRA